MLFQETDPWQRTQQFLVEIHKRVLAEEVLLLQITKSDLNIKIIQTAPDKNQISVDKKILVEMVKLANEKKDILLLDDFKSDPDFFKLLNINNISNLLVAPFNFDNDYYDVLVILNLSMSRYPGKILDFVTAISSVLALSLQNARLFNELKNKTALLKEWSAEVERRIQDGTKRLLEQEFQFHALFEGANDGIVVHDKDGAIFEANHVACQMLGYNRKQLVDMKWTQIVPKEALDNQQLFFENVLKKTTDRPLDTKLLKANGNSFFAEISSRRVWFHGEETIQSFIRNISLRKQLEISLKESKNKYRILVESSLVSVFNLRGDTILFANSQFESLTGFSKEELFDVGFYSLVHPEDRIWVTERERRRENGEEVPEHYEIRLMRKNGQLLWCEIRSRRVILKGQPTILGNIIDITERKTMARELLETKKMESISTLAGGIAHDFNNLLGGILGYASLLLSDMPESHPYYADIETISRTAKRAAELTSRLLAFARGGKYQVRRLNINNIISQILPILKENMDQTMILDTNFHSDIWLVSGDAIQIQQAILNICINGIDSLRGHGKISIETHCVSLDSISVKETAVLEKGDYVQVIISDNGQGMDDRTKNRVFEPFFTTKTAGDGAGLGMAMVYGVIKNHGGGINIKSEIQLGTTVTLYLPRIVQEPKTAITSVQKKTKLGNRILLVDDELVIREVGQRMLERGGFSVITAENGIEALKIFEKEHDNIDLVLLDWMMPFMGGKECSRRLKEILPSVLICFLSGYSPEDKPELLQMGNQFFIQKPFQTEILIKTIQKILQNNR